MCRKYAKTFDPDELAGCIRTFDASKLSASSGCCIEHSSATPKEASQGSQNTLPICPKQPRFPVPAFIWASEAGSFQYIFRKYMISFGQESLAVGSLRLPRICFTLIQTVSHQQPEDKMASLCVYWLC